MHDRHPAPRRFQSSVPPVLAIDLNCTRTSATLEGRPLPEPAAAAQTPRPEREPFRGVSARHAGAE